MEMNAVSTKSVPSLIVAVAANTDTGPIYPSLNSLDRLHLHLQSSHRDGLRYAWPLVLLSHVAMKAKRVCWSNMMTVDSLAYTYQASDLDKRDEISP